MTRSKLPWFVSSWKSGTVRRVWAVLSLRRWFHLGDTQYPKPMRRCQNRDVNNGDYKSGIYKRDKYYPV
jgi:hypothetical protein